MDLYILKSKKIDRYYVGISNDTQRRITEHNYGKTISTKNYGPWKIIYTEKHPDYKSAREREKYLKSYKGVAEKRKIISEHSEVV